MMLAGKTEASAGGSAGCSTRSLCRKLFDQTFIGVHLRQRFVAVDRGRGGPGQLLACPGFDERREPAGLVQHRRPQIDEPVETLGPSEHPAYAVRAEIVTGGAVQATDDRL